MTYQLIINKNDEKIVLNENNISSIIINSKAFNSLKRNTQIEVKLKLHGKIKKIFKSKERKHIYNLISWSLSSYKKKSDYRDLTLEIINDNKVLRGIHFPQACIVKYEENYIEEFMKSKYVICFEQRKEQLENTKIKFDYTPLYNKEGYKLKDIIKIKLKNTFLKIINLFKKNKKL